MNKLPSIYPKEWVNEFRNTLKTVFFRNLTHFKNKVSKLKQIEDTKCGVSYSNALDDLLRNKSQFKKDDYESVRNLVRANLFKRGLITDLCYESYKYSTDGVQLGVDIGKYANGEPDCVITPSIKYVDFFYELFVSISYRADLSNSEISHNINKLIVTIEELERQHIFIKLTLVLPIHKVDDIGDIDFFSTIPLFSHKDVKSAETMSSVLNDRLLRKFYFAVLEDELGDDLSQHYGYVKELEGAINLNQPINEIDLFTEIQTRTGFR